MTAGSTLSLPRRYASPLVCGIDVAYTRIMVDKGEQWIENCFIFRFLIRQGVSFFLGIEIVSTDNVPQLLYETSKSSLFYLRVGNVPLFPKLICNRISISNLIISQNHYHRIFQILNRILTYPVMILINMINLILAIIYLLSLSATFTITKKFHHISRRIQGKILFKHSFADRNSAFPPEKRKSILDL